MANIIEKCDRTKKEIINIKKVSESLSQNEIKKFDIWKHDVDSIILEYIAEAFNVRIRPKDTELNTEPYIVINFEFCNVFINQLKK